MPFKTRYGSHYHMTQGCHGATIPCGTEGLTPCSDCCGAGAGAGAGSPMLDGGTRMYSQGYDAETGTVPVRLSGDAGDATIVPVFDADGHLTGVTVVGSDGTEFQLSDEARADAEETLRQAAVGAARDAIAESAGASGVSALEGAEIALRGAERARLATRREDDLKAAVETTDGGMASKVAPMVSQEEIQARMASLEHELELLRAQAELAKAFPEYDPANPYALAEQSLSEEIDSFFDDFWGGNTSPELRAEHIVDSVSQIAYEVCSDMERRSANGKIDDAVAAERIADRLEVEGYGDKLDDEVKKRLGWDGDTQAIQAIDVVRRRRAERASATAQAKESPKVSEWYDNGVAGRIDAIQDEVMTEMGLDSVPMDKRDEMIDRIAQRIEDEGLADRLDDDAMAELTANNAHTASLAAKRVMERRGLAGASGKSTGRVPLEPEERKRTAKPRGGRRPATGGKTAPAKGGKPRRRAAKKVDPLGGMTPKQEQDAFDREFSTHETEAYMGARGYEGSKSGQSLYGKQLSGAVRDDMKTWLGHLGVPRGAVRVAVHTYSGGQSLKVETKLDRTQFGASESEFKSAYRKHFWKVTPDWGTVETSTGPVDVSKLMEPGDQGPLMEDIIDTAWRRYQSGETEVDCGRGGAWGNPRHEIYLNEQGRKVASRMQRIVDAYNYDDSNGMVDYFSTNFYAYPRVRLS